MEQGTSMTVTTHGSCRTGVPHLRAGEAVGFHQHPGLPSMVPRVTLTLGLSEGTALSSPASSRHELYNLPALLLAWFPSPPADLPFHLNHKSTYIREMQILMMRCT